MVPLMLAKFSCYHSTTYITTLPPPWEAYGVLQYAFSFTCTVANCDYDEFTCDNGECEPDSSQYFHCSS